MSSLTTSEFTIDEDISGNALINRELQTLLVPFWSDNPNVLFQSKYIGEFFPVDSMTYNQKLNAVTRTVIVLTILSFLYARRVRVIVVVLSAWRLSLPCIIIIRKKIVKF